MVHSFKLGGRRIAYDSASGSLHLFGELAYKMLDYIELPMPKDCPSALRYDLAKYDSAAIDETYEELVTLYRAGALYGAEEAFTASEEPLPWNGFVLRLADGSVISHDNPSLLERALALAEAGEDTDIGLVIDAAGEGEAPLEESDFPALFKECEKLAKEQIARTGSDRSFIAFKLDACDGEQTFPVCRGCWARKLCGLPTCGERLCELERKCIECALAAENI